jgi:hypothetical protein
MHIVMGIMMDDDTSQKYLVGAVVPSSRDALMFFSLLVHLLLRLDGTLFHAAHVTRHTPESKKKFRSFREGGWK